MLVIQALRPDRLQSAMNTFAAKCLGKFLRNTEHFIKLFNSQL